MAPYLPSELRTMIGANVDKTTDAKNFRLADAALGEGASSQLFCIVKINIRDYTDLKRLRNFVALSNSSNARFVQEVEVVADASLSMSETDESLRLRALEDGKIYIPQNWPGLVQELVETLPDALGRFVNLRILNLDLRATKEIFQGGRPSTAIIYPGMQHLLRPCLLQRLNKLEELRIQSEKASWKEVLEALQSELASRGTKLLFPSLTLLKILGTPKGDSYSIIERLANPRTLCIKGPDVVNHWQPEGLSNLRELRLLSTKLRAEDLIRLLKRNGNTLQRANMVGVHLLSDEWTQVFNACTELPALLHLNATNCGYSRKGISYHYAEVPVITHGQFGPIYPQPKRIWSILDTDHDSWMVLWKLLDNRCIVARREDLRMKASLQREVRLQSRRSL